MTSLITASPRDGGSQVPEGHRFFTRTVQPKALTLNICWPLAVPTKACKWILGYSRGCHDRLILPGGILMVLGRTPAEDTPPGSFFSSMLLTVLSVVCSQEKNILREGLKVRVQGLATEVRQASRSGTAGRGDNTPVWQKGSLVTIKVVTITNVNSGKWKKKMSKDKFFLFLFFFLK